ncbi:MAG TPA: phosphatidylserine decarboxylase, partial [bacterium]|nr:phosphatidylserine decarboxylase [bacterium]
KQGDRVDRGTRCGIMKFGSRMDIIVPKNVDIKVKVGDTTTAGETILGIIK